MEYMCRKCCNHFPPSEAGKQLNIGTPVYWPLPLTTHARIFRVVFCSCPNVGETSQQLIIHWPLAMTRLFLTAVTAACVLLKMNFSEKKWWDKISP